MNMSNILKAMLEKNLISMEEINTYGKDVLRMLGTYDEDTSVSELREKERELIRDFSKNQEKALVLFLAKKIIKDMAKEVEDAGEEKKGKREDRHAHFLKPNMTIRDLKDKVNNKLSCYRDE